MPQPWTTSASASVGGAGGIVTLVEGSSFCISSNGGVQPRWRQDGKEIFYVSLAGELTATEVTPVTMQVGRTQVLLDSITTNRGYLWDVADNGQRFLVAVEGTHRASTLTLLQNPLARQP